MIEYYFNNVALKRDVPVVSDGVCQSKKKIKLLKKKLLKYQSTYLVTKL